MVMVVRSYETLDRTSFVEGLFLDTTHDSQHFLLHLTRVVVNGESQPCCKGATIKVISDMAREGTIHPKLEYYTLMDWVHALDRDI